MTSNPDPAPSSPLRRHRGWILLVLALAWVALVRVPLVLNAEDHLDSDLAVDGLTLIEALQRHWRWHYPATPFIGSPPVLLSYLQARIWGPTPATLTSGGVVSYGLLVVAAYALNRRAFGPSVAAWGLVPLAFASTGVVWLSGRVTGGHLLAAAWHAGAFLLLWDALTRRGWWRPAALGLWCGFGLYVDSMFAVTLAGLGVAMLGWAFSSSPLPLGEGPVVRGVASPVGRKADGRGRHPTGDVPHPNPLEGARRDAPHPNPLPEGEGAGGDVPHPNPLPGGEGARGNRVVRSVACLLAFGLAGGVGVIPRMVGQRVDPHDAYVGQFEPVVQVDHLAANAGILLRDCLPRLVAGHRLPGLETEPDPARLEAASPSTSRLRGVPWLALAVSVVSLGLFGWAMVGLAWRPRGAPPDPARSAIRLGLLASTLAVVAGFLVYPSISNSDHYRYLVLLLVPWSSGFGLRMARLASKGRGGPWVAGALVLGFAALMTADSARWYARFGWVDSAYLPTHKAVPEPVVDWLEDHLKVSTILGDYWDVYRISFLTFGRVRAVPFPQYPDRFPEIGRGLAKASNPVVLVRPGSFGPLYRTRALEAGGHEQMRGRGFSIVTWPKGIKP